MTEFTRLSDVIEPRVFLEYMFNETRVKSALFDSGILENDPSFSGFLRGGGRTVDVPHWEDLGDGSDPNIGGDDPTSSAPTDKMIAGSDVAIRHNRNKGWGTTRMSRILAGDDPARRIAENAAAWWRRSFNLHMINTLTGVFADNAANDSGDMRHVIATDDAGAITAAELISADAILDAAQTMGDTSEDGSFSLFMHSVCLTELKKQNLIDYIPNSRGEVQFPTYLGYPIVVDDNCPAVAGTNRINYSTYLIGRGAIAWAEEPLPANEAVEVYRLPAPADGQGVDELWTRRQYLMHPRGIAWQGASLVGFSPTNAELANALNWDRVYPERKQVRLVELVTNG